MALRVNTAFDSGVLGDIVELTDDRVVATIYREWDQDHRCTQATWFHARVDGCRGPLTIELRGLGDIYEGRPSRGIVQADVPAQSDDGVTWRREPCHTVDADAATLTIRLVPRGESIWLANLEPYVQANLDRLAADLAATGLVSFGVAGESLGGRPIPIWTVGADSAPRAVWLMARQHAWETHTSFCLEGFARWLVSDAGAGLRGRCQVTLLPWMDPDGVVRGASRFNAQGWDLNRHWDTTDPDDPEQARQRPEIAAGKRALRAAGRPLDLFLNLHDTQRDIFVPAPACESAPVLRAVWAHLASGRFSGGYRPGDLGGPGVVQTAMHAELGCPSALIELGTVALPTYRRPVTAADRVAFGAELGRAIEAAVGNTATAPTVRTGQMSR